MSQAALDTYRFRGGCGDWANGLQTSTDEVSSAPTLHHLSTFAYLSVAAAKCRCTEDISSIHMSTYMLYAYEERENTIYCVCDGCVTDSYSRWGLSRRDADGLKPPTSRRRSGAARDLHTHASWYLVIALRFTYLSSEATVGRRVGIMTELWISSHPRTGAPLHSRPWVAQWCQSWVGRSYSWAEVDESYHLDPPPPLA